MILVAAYLRFQLDTTQFLINRIVLLPMPYTDLCVVLTNNSLFLSKVCVHNMSRYTCVCECMCTWHCVWTYAMQHVCCVNYEVCACTLQVPVKCVYK